MKKPNKKARQNWVKTIREYILELGGIEHSTLPHYFTFNHKVEIIVRRQERHTIMYSIFAKFNKPYPIGTSNMYSGKHNYHTSFTGDDAADIKAAKVFIDQLKAMVDGNS